MSITQGYDERRRGGFSLYGILSVAFILVLFLQLYRSMTIDTYALGGTRLDLLGLAICHLIGAVLILRAAISGRLMMDVLILCGVLMTYIAIIIASTSLDSSLLDVLFSRYGILNWLLLGWGTAAAASYIALPTGSRQALVQRRLFIGAAAIIGLLLTFFSLTYLGYPVLSISYQSVANNLIVILLVLMIFTQVLWGGRVPIVVVIGLLAVGTLAVTAVARLQSTSIVGFWIVGLIVYFWGALSKLPPKYKALLLVAGIFGAVGYLSSDLFSQALEKTRFAGLLGGGRFSSIDSRLDLLTDFGRQFAVSPIFGNFSAEVVAGSGLGNYPHSLVSFLSHTGVVGTVLVGVVLFLIYSRRLPLRRLSPPDFQQLLLMSVILALGITFAFMTWSVFWFMLGFMCKTPILKAAGATR